jgi:predicted RNA-binding Zn ribbon-like protein
VSQPHADQPVDPRPLVGEPLCLDLLNTRWIDDTGLQDLLESTAGLDIWLRSAGLHHRATADPATLDALRRTREALLALVDGDPTPERRDALNRVLARGALHHRLDPVGPQTRPQTDEPAWLPAWLAAADYVRLLREAPTRIKRCAAHPKCVLHFHDATKNGTRRWCSMAACGNRAKAARHYERNRTSR